MIDKYNKRVDASHSLLCVGLDSDADQLPERFKSAEFPQFAFNQHIIEETHEYTAAYKLNTAFYEARGDEGIRELKMTFEYLRETHPDIFTIVDAKRADIGNTNKGTAAFLYDWLGADAATVHPYLGKEALEPFLSRKDKAVIVLCRTSNPGASEFQDLVIDGEPLWSVVARSVAEDWNENNNCMLVAGATYPSELGKIRRLVGDMTLLVPGVGAQGGSVRDVMEAGLTVSKRGLIVNSSRGIIFASEPGEAARLLRDEITSYR